MKEQALHELLAFLVSSALECADEPSPYGSLRLMEAAQQLIEFALAGQITGNQALGAIAERIAVEKGTALQDRERFRGMIENCACDLIDCG